MQFLNKHIHPSFRTNKPLCHSEPTGEESHTNPNSHSEPTTAPRIKRVHSNSNRKNTFSDYEFSIFTLS